MEWLPSLEQGKEAEVGRDHVCILVLVLRWGLDLSGFGSFVKWVVCITLPLRSVPSSGLGTLLNGVGDPKIPSPVPGVWSVFKSVVLGFFPPFHLDLSLQWN